MEKIVISTPNAPAAIGPYAQGIRLGDVVYTSGQLPIDPKTGELVSDDIKKATRQSLENVKAVLEAGGSSVGKIVKVLILLNDINDFAAMNEVYNEFFEGTEYPARSAFEVATLPKNALIEIEAVGHI
ncbi:Enamine/imine deaminase [Sebaldella termitidis]|jgi:2-iminobutanoate/2-iminopropanoate deaminase|uniref:Endoribonuclease L-PSP n=1 Tax=Sebaldella termitidis (strain ATCC 33386 / NCTC 11300) TaxID=526218 RepID=D1AIE8_SEBTE|nr:MULTISPECIES: RidA family protein [Sebaldella]ACZ08532.1 endoribonuclease L-PSP [Sebaldella termitidis ATCC 33386]MBP7979459.1 RidA family protein [Sebaldella sp.]MCP1223036.1 RidA family protein [Sebaldella sp. S0638]SUI23846.1 Enamine/imine deaminase [Sebaldella termitidis]